MSEQIQKKKKSIIGVIIAIVLLAVVAVVFSIVVFGSTERKVNKRIGLAEKYLHELNYDRAIDMYEEVIKLDPTCVKAYLGLADIYVIQGKYEKAGKILNKALKYITDEGDIEEIEDKIREVAKAEEEANAGEPVTGNTVVEKEPETEPEQEEEPEEEEIVETEDFSDHWKPMSGLEDTSTYYEYNDAGQIVKTYDDFLDTDYGYYKLYEYHENGKLKKITTYDHAVDSDLVEDGFYEIETQTYNEYGLLTESQGYSTIWYMQQGWDYYSGYEYEYSATGLPTVQREYSRDGELWIITYYEYDEAGNLVRMYSTDAEGEPYYADPDYVYEYVKVGDKYLVSHEEYSIYEEGGIGKVIETYEYDAYGNLIKKTTKVSDEDGFYNYYEELYEYSPVTFPAGEPGDEFERIITYTYTSSPENTFIDSYTITYKYY